MENAQLIALSRQSALRNQLNVVANNMANLNTTGFKSQRMLFEEFIMPVAEATEFKRQDQDVSFVHDYGTRTNLLQGSVKLTGNDLDLAIEGEGWFTIQTEDGGQAYTRNGSFHLDGRGQLVTSEGRPVLADGGPIIFSAEDGKVEVAHDGTIASELGIRGKISLVDFENPQTLVQSGDTLFTSDEPIPVVSVKVMQGALEESNVHGIDEVTRLIEITRAYESISKLMKESDELRRQAISTLGRLEA